MPQGQKTWSKKRPKGIKKETTNIYQPHSISLYFPSENKQKTSFFCNNSKKNQSPFFCNIFKRKKKLLSKIFAIPSLKDLTWIPPSPFKNITLPLYSTPYGTEKLELFVVLQYLCSKRYLPCFLLYVLYFSN